jgi:hypothetical protein
MGFYLLDPLVILILLGSISSWAFKPYYDDGLLDISPTACPDLALMLACVTLHFQAFLEH